MVFGHTHYSCYFHKLIYGFHMPLFFVISGYLYHKPDNIYAYTRKKVKSLLLPYMTFGLFYSLMKLIFDGKTAFLIGLKGVAIEVTNGIPYESSLWFLVVLFFVSVIYAFLDGSISSTIIRVILIFGLTVSGCLWSTFLKRLPWGINIAMSTIGFFELGRVSRGKIEPCMDTITKNSFCFLLVFIMSCLVTLLTPKINVRTGEFGIFPLNYLNAYIMSMILIFTFKNNSERNNQSHFDNYLQGVGRSSIIYVCINHPAIRVVRKIIDSFGVSRGSVLEIIIECIGVLLLIYVITRFIIKTPIKHVFSI